MPDLPPCLLIVTAEVDADVEEAWNRWYDDVHLPDALACPGVLSGSRYVSSVFTLFLTGGWHQPIIHQIRGRNSSGGGSLSMGLRKGTGGRPDKDECVVGLQFCQ